MIERQVIVLKKLLTILALSLAFAGMMAVAPFYDSCRDLSDDVLRVHILPNSNSAVDQELKLRVRDRVLRDCSAYYDGCEDKEEAMRITRDHLGEIERSAQQEVRACGFDYPVHAEVLKMYFNTRYYEGFTMPAGYYSALRLTIGEGKGDNWWCVMYPELCVGAASAEKLSEDLSDGEYRVVTCDQLDFRFKLVEYYEGFLNLFR